MLWKSNISNCIPENKENSIEEIKNNRIDDGKNTSITVDARKSDNYNYAAEDIYEL